MVVDSAATKAEFWSALQEITEIRNGGGGGVAEVQLAVEDLGEFFIERDGRELAAEAPVVLASNPT